MEISKMLTMSTAHIKKSTAEWLQNEWQQCSSLAVYKKGVYGWFVFVSNADVEDETANIPEDLVCVINAAKKAGCDWLCLDSDGEKIDDLPEFKW